VITSPDNPTGRTLTAEEQVALGKAALRQGAAFVLYDWMYHVVTDGSPMDLGRFIAEFDADEKPRLMFLDGITKSLGASNVRNGHLVASEIVIRYIAARASHAVIPSFHSMAVAMAAYEMGFPRAAATIVAPTNASRKELAALLPRLGLRHIMGQGYYAFLHVGEWIRKKGWADGERLGQYLAEMHGLAVVPGAFFSPYGGEWIRFSYAMPPARTIGAAHRLMEGLNALASE
jgi:aspartate/methionine/tyrosine aminotransferase